MRGTVREIGTMFGFCMKCLEDVIFGLTGECCGSGLFLKTERGCYLCDPVMFTPNHLNCIYSSTDIEPKGWYRFLYLTTRLHREGITFHVVHSLLSSPTTRFQFLTTAAGYNDIR